MNILLIGDGALARDLADAIEKAGHTVRALVVQGYDPYFLDSRIDGDEDIAIEAIITDLSAKREAISALGRLLPDNTPILTATLNATATEVATWSEVAERVVGFSALPPFANATVVEAMRALQSGDDAIEKTDTFWRSIGREPVHIADCVGGVLPRTVCNLINEAAFALMEGVATPADIDLAMQLGVNHPRGPFTWADLIGVSEVCAVLEALGNEYGADMYRPAPLLKQYARAGWSFYGPAR